MASEVSKTNSVHRKNSKTVLRRRILRQKSGLLGAFLILLFLTTAALPWINRRPPVHVSS
jgi:hypothetical protein